MLMTKINEQKELLTYHMIKIAEIKKAVESCKTKDDLVFQFFQHFADIEQASIEVKRDIVNLLVESHKNLAM